MPLFALIWVVMMPSWKEKGTINLGWRFKISSINQTIFYGKKEMQEGNYERKGNALSVSKRYGWLAKPSVCRRPFEDGTIIYSDVRVITNRFLYRQEQDSIHS
jgi:hypothetical protein